MSQFFNKCKFYIHMHFKTASKHTRQKDMCWNKDVDTRTTSSGEFNTLLSISSWTRRKSAEIINQLNTTFNYFNLNDPNRTFQNIHSSQPNGTFFLPWHKSYFYLIEVRQCTLLCYIWIKLEISNRHIR